MLFYTLAFLRCFLFDTPLFLIHSRFTLFPSHIFLSSLELPTHCSHLLASDICLKQGPGDFRPCYVQKAIQCHAFWEASRWRVAVAPGRKRFSSSGDPEKVTQLTSGRTFMVDGGRDLPGSSFQDWDWPGLLSLPGLSWAANSHWHRGLMRTPLPPHLGFAVCRRDVQKLTSEAMNSPFPSWNTRPFHIYLWAMAEPHPSGLERPC